MGLRSLSYTSRARLDLTEADVAAIHESARRLNPLDGITGLLVFDGTRFLQLVEGSPEAIDDLMARLRRDDRHASIEVRDDRTVPSRSFSDWSMELVRVSTGYQGAREEIESLLPPSVGPEVRALVGKMADKLAVSLP